MSFTIHTKPNCLRTPEGRSLFWEFVEYAVDKGFFVIAHEGPPARKDWAVNLVFEDYDHEIDTDYFVNVLICRSPTTLANPAPTMVSMMTPEAAVYCLIRHASLLDVAMTQWLTADLDDAIDCLATTVKSLAEQRPEQQPARA